MADNNIRDIYSAVPVEDLHKIRALIRQGVALDIIADRAGLPLAVIKHAAARVHRAEKRLKRRLATSSLGDG